jgi:hypothetical protein
MKRHIIDADILDIEPNKDLPGPVLALFNEKLQKLKPQLDKQLKEHGKPLDYIYEFAKFAQVFTDDIECNEVWEKLYKINPKASKCLAEYFLNIFMNYKVSENMREHRNSQFKAISELKEEVIRLKSMIDSSANILTYDISFWTYINEGTKPKTIIPNEINEELKSILKKYQKRLEIAEKELKKDEYFFKAVYPVSRSKNLKNITHSDGESKTSAEIIFYMKSFYYFFQATFKKPYYGEIAAFINAIFDTFYTYKSVESTIKKWKSVPSNDSSLPKVRV